MASPHAVSSFYPDGVFYVYVLRSESDSGFYIGFSTNLKRRLSEHTRGASFATKSRGPWKLIYRIKRLRLTRSYHFILRGCSMHVLRSESDSGFYIGFSTNLRVRLRQHQEGESFATSHRGPW